LSKEYIVTIRQWCDELLASYHGIIEELQERGEILNAFEEWEQQLVQFQNELTEVSTMEEMEIYERANQLYLQFKGYFEVRDSKETADEKSQVQTPSGTVPIGGHTLPPLPYNYDALEPYINQEIMRLHHDKHHKSYVDGLNKAEKEMQKARTSNNFDLIKHWEREAAFHGAGHYLHTIFWTIMSPNGGDKPSGMLMREINQSFGSFEKFKVHFTEAANNVEGVGWAILVWSPRSRRLEILQAEKHQNLSQWDVVPILVLDVWEHAYYLQYKNERKKYVDNWWNIVNWQEVESRFHEAQQLKWKPF
jgi:Fe-Mn family superoxide dismutase